MKDIETFKDGNKDQIDRAKLNLVYVAMFSVLMLFAGFISAYIVSMGDAFWLKIPFPSSFWISTILILVSSLTLMLGQRFIKAGNIKGLKAMMSITLVLGLSFVYFQFKGYGQLVDNGIHFSFNRILVTDGRYGDYFEIEKQGSFYDVNGNDYILNDKKLTAAQLKDLQSFMKQFTTPDKYMRFKVTNYGKHKLYFNSLELKREGNKLITSRGDELSKLDAERLFFLARNICDGRGDFYARGEMGKDFHVYYQGSELTYVKRELRFKGQKLTPYMQVKVMESYDTSSSFLYIITFVHLLHVIITVLFLLRAVIFSFSGKISQDNTVRLQMTGIFWHFLGLLWVVLLLFLLFIH